VKVLDLGLAKLADDTAAPGGPMIYVGTKNARPFVVIAAGSRNKYERNFTSDSS
jgi:hypothetical protein